MIVRIAIDDDMRRIAKWLTPERASTAAMMLVQRLSERPDLRVVESYQVDLGCFVEVGDAVYVAPDVMLRARLFVAWHDGDGRPHGAGGE